MRIVIEFRNGGDLTVRKNIMVMAGWCAVVPGVLVFGEGVNMLRRGTRGQRQGQGGDRCERTRHGSSVWGLRRRVN